MSEIINKYFLEDDDLGVIRTKSYRLLHDEKLTDEEKRIIEYIKVVSQLSLTDGDSYHESISEHRPGQQTLAILKTWIGNISNPYLKGLLYDVLQCNKIDKFVNATAAIETYFMICEDRYILSSKRDYYFRIISILKGLGKGNNVILPQYFEKIKQEILKSEISTECYSVTYLITELTTFNLEPVEYDPFVQMIESEIGQLLESSEFKQYRQCHRVLAKLKKEDSNYHNTEVARAYIMEADEFDLRENASQHMIAALYEKGLRIFRFLNIKNEQTEFLSHKLHEIRLKAAAQLSLFGVSLPISINSDTIVLPDFENIYQAVYWLISFDVLPKSELVEELEKRKKSFMAMQFLGSAMTDSQGNTIGLSPDNEKVMYRDASDRRGVFCKVVLIPVYNTFSDNFAISELEVYELVVNSKFVDPAQYSLYTHGLYNGFCGNFAVALHLLIPQIEAGLRNILKNRGIITTKYLDEVQTENGLTSSLKNLKGILQEDLLFELEGLLNEPFGDNLRNDLSHGLLGMSKLYSAPGFYTWWLALKLCLDIDSYIRLEN